MAKARLRLSKRLGEAAFPLRAVAANVELDLDLGDLDVPPPARRRIALEALRDLLREADPSDVALDEGAPQRPAPTVPRADWEKPPELDLRIVKSAHRIVQEVARRGARGRAVLASELVAESDLSAPTIGRLLRSGHPAADYLSHYVRASQHGRTKALDLTPEGQELASRIRAGTVPV